ncbi:MAG: multidrug ABC transporter permease [Rhodospirillales bacterium]|nr:MAG: multidrug ABC transporter permease [Rhodospirillales bacterium]
MNMRVAFALAWREWIRFIRQPQRVVGSVGQPLLFWLFLGSGFSPSFKPPGMGEIGYLEYFYPGALLMMLLFAGIFSCITVIEDRDQGFLQSVLAAPVARISIVAGKVGGAALIALAQCLILLAAAPLAGLMPSFGGALLLLLGLVLASVGFTALGFGIAWGMNSTSGFHAVMMVFLMPLWMLSGALFPTQGAPEWLSLLIQVNPVSHALTLIRAPFYADVPHLLGDATYLTALGIAAAWAALCLAFSLWRVGKVEKGINPVPGT